MEPHLQKRLARIALLSGAVAGLACLGRLDLDRRISTNVLDLVPVDERSPELSLVRNLAGEEQARALLLALSVPPRAGEPGGERGRRAERAAALFSRALAADPAIAQSMPLSNEGPRETLAAAIYARRFDLLLPGWLAQRESEFGRAAPGTPWSPWLAERSASALEAYLSKPEALATQDILQADPLLLVPGLVARMNGLVGAGALPSNAVGFSAGCPLGL